MDSSATLSGSAQIVQKQCDNNIFPAKTNPSSRGTPSFSYFSSIPSCSSSLGSLYFSNESTISPVTPFKFSGVPFSWETLPGIPKKIIPIKKESLRKQLPLPPTSTLPSSKNPHFEEFGSRKKISPESFQKDPFIAALLECSKEDDIQDSSSRNKLFNGAKITRRISDRFGFINLTSCKRTCAVSESLVYLPRSTRISYDLIHHNHIHRRHAR